MKSVKELYLQTNKIKKIFKLFSDPQINLTRHKHNLWPYYYREYEQLNYFTDLIKKYGLIEIVFDTFYLLGQYPYTNIKEECRQRLRILKDENNDTLIQILWKIIEPNKSIQITPLNDYLITRYEDIREGLSKAYLMYSLMIYCYGVDFMPLLKEVEKEQDQ